MATTTLTLADFLLARIAEDEGLVIHTGDDRMSLERWLAQCDARRRIVQRFVDQVENFGGPWDAPTDRLWPEYGGGYLLGLREAVQELALPYADHPDFREEWRPDGLG